MLKTRKRMNMMGMVDFLQGCFAEDGGNVLTSAGRRRTILTQRMVVLLPLALTRFVP